MSHVAPEHSGARDTVSGEPPCDAVSGKPLMELLLAERKARADDLLMVGKMLQGLPELLLRTHGCLKRWAARYAESAHAQKAVKETRLLMQELTEWHEKLPRHSKD